RLPEQGRGRPGVRAVPARADGRHGLPHGRHPRRPPDRHRRGPRGPARPRPGRLRVPDALRGTAGPPAGAHRIRGPGAGLRSLRRRLVRVLHAPSRRAPGQRRLLPARCERLAMDAITEVPVPANEPVHGYPPGSPERAALDGRIKELSGSPLDLTMTIGGERRMAGGAPIDVVQPHNHAALLGRTAEATADDVRAAIDAALGAAAEW